MNDFIELLLTVLETGSDCVKFRAHPLWIDHFEGRSLCESGSWTSLFALRFYY